MKRAALLLLTLIMGFMTDITLSQQQGVASYYSSYLQGKKMSGGGYYHSDSLTCAHRTLPFGTLLEVRNLSNNRSVIVKVTDRGPFIGRRIIDLSYAAAKKLGIIRQGVALVEIEKVKLPAVKEPASPFQRAIIPYDEHGLFITGEQ